MINSIGTRILLTLESWIQMITIKEVLTCHGADDVSHIGMKQ